MELVWNKYSINNLELSRRFRRTKIANEQPPAKTIRRAEI